MTYDIYLQGSYRNDTNIRGDSDVDLVLEFTSSYKSDVRALSLRDRQGISKPSGPPISSLNSFRQEAVKGLRSGFGSGMVIQGNKSIKVKAASSRLAADVVVCMQFRRFTKSGAYQQGMTLWALQDKRWVINYPKLHYRNGADKSSRTHDRYKRTVRMFKNVRNYLVSQRKISAKSVPSYFLEGLLYNAPDEAFQAGFQQTYCSVVNWMAKADLKKLVCQNGQQYFFGPSAEQWALTRAKVLTNRLVALWNNWS